MLESSSLETVKGFAALISVLSDGGHLKAAYQLFHFLTSNLKQLKHIVIILLGLVDNFEYSYFKNLTSKKCLKSGGNLVPHFQHIVTNLNLNTYFQQIVTNLVPHFQHIVTEGQCSWQG